MSGEDAPRPCLENLIVLEIKTNKQTNMLKSKGASSGKHDPPSPCSSGYSCRKNERHAISLSKNERHAISLQRGRETQTSSYTHAYTKTFFQILFFSGLDVNVFVGTFFLSIFLSSPTDVSCKRITHGYGFDSPPSQHQQHHTLTRT